MKVPAILLSACFLLIASHSVRAQADCFYWIRVEVRDQADAPIKNAKLKLDDWQEFYFWENSKKYEATGLMGVGAPVWQAKLRVKAKGFKQLLKN